MVTLVRCARAQAFGPVLLVTLLALVAALVLGGATIARSDESVPDPRPSSGPCSTPAPGLIGTSERTLVFDGTVRRYLVHVPVSYDGSRPLPVVVLFHGLGRDPESMLRMTRFDQLADTEDAIVIAPQALGTVPAWRFREVDGREGADLPFVDALIDDVRGLTCTDETRTYAVGFSNGGALTMALACSADDRFAAYAAVAGPYRTRDCDRAPARPLVLLHGLKDKVVPVRGARETRIGSLPSAVRTTQRWATQNGCRPATRNRLPGGITRLVYAPCAGGADVEAWFLGRGTHRWPGGGKPGATTETPRTEPAAGDIDATQVIWDFLRTYTSTREPS